MLNLESIAVDPSKAREGVWFEYMGGRFLVARQGQDYKEKLSKLFNEHRELVISKTPEGNLKAIDIYRECFADHILLDWDQIIDKDGELVPYDREKGLALARDPKYYELIEALERFSLVHTNYQEHVEQEVAEEVKSSAVS